MNVNITIRAKRWHALVVYWAGVLMISAIIGTIIQWTCEGIGLPVWFSVVIRTIAGIGLGMYAGRIWHSREEPSRSR